MIHRALKMVRAYHHINQKELAKRLGLSCSHISELESGIKRPTLDTLYKYSEYFKIPTSAFLLFSEHLSGSQDKSDEVRQALAERILKILEWIHACNNFDKENVIEVVK